MAYPAMTSEKPRTLGPTHRWNRAWSRTRTTLAMRLSSVSGWINNLEVTMSDTVSISSSAAAGIGAALNQDVYEVSSCDRMAWLVLLLKQCEDKSEWFPRGKWATIQHIELQLHQCVESYFAVNQNPDPSK